MITLIAGQEAATAPEYKVMVGGDYEPADLVLVYGDDAALPVGQFQAAFIATGEFV